MNTASVVPKWPSVIDTSLMLIEGKSLSTDQAAQVMNEIMEGEVTPAQFGAFVTALRLKGETVEEIAGLVKTMRAKAVPVLIKESYSTNWH